MSPRTRLALLGAAALVALLAGCGGSGHATAPLTPRTYRMGFALSAPRQDFPLILQALDQMTRRSDAAIMSTEAPWDSLLAGTSRTASCFGRWCRSPSTTGARTSASGSTSTRERAEPRR
jgi:hypothetical protein